MISVTPALRRQSARFVALTLCLVLFWLARQPEISVAERKEIADRFRFTRSDIPASGNVNSNTTRKVKPSLNRIVAWVSSTGAGIALNDLDNDGISNDLCLVDPRTNSITVSPSPGTAQRYQQLRLDAGALYDQATMAPMACIPGDLNEDGLMDLLIPLWGRTPLVFLASGSADNFIPAADRYVVQEIVSGGGQWFTGAATMADLDGDGHLDIVIGNYFSDDSKILNEDAWEHDNEMQHSMSRAFNAGRSRLLRWEAATSGPKPSVTFREVTDYIDIADATEKERLTRGWTLATAAADINGDLLPDLYFANDFGPDRLLLNQSRPGRLRFVPLAGTKTLTTPSSKVLGRDSFKGMGVDVADVNEDGLFDMYVSNIAADYSLHESHFLFINNGDFNRLNDGVAPFIDQSERFGVSRSGWAWDTKMGDFDNDGHLEIVQATGFVKGEVNRWPELQELALTNDQLLSNPRNWPRLQPGDALSDNHHNPFFVRGSDGRFYDFAPELGLNKRQISRGIATADVNCDGRLDFAVANQWDTSSVFLNETPTANAFLGIRLRLPIKQTTAKIQTYTWGFPCSPPHDLLTRPAIGAVVSVERASAPRAVAQVDGGNGHSGKRSPDLQFGLGRVSPESRLAVHIRWRDAGGEIRTDILHLSPGWHTIVLN